MMEKLATLIPCTALFGLGVLAEGDVEISVPGQTNAAQRVPTNTLHLLGALRLPYEGDPHAAESTIGQLSKQSEVVVVANVRTAQVTEAAATLRQMGTLRIEIAVETNLFGNPPAAALALSSRWTRGVPVPEPGAKVIAFLSTDTFSPSVHHTHTWSFDRTKVRGRAEGQLCLLGQERGMLPLEAEDGDALLLVTAGYLRHLRQADRDAHEYYGFLRRQMHSSIARIHKDATQDLLYLLRSCKAIDLDEVAKDASIEKSIRNYVNLVLRPARASPNPTKVELGP